MSTTTGSANSARYVDFDEYVDLKLQKTRSSIKSTDLLVALAGVAAMFLGYLLTFVVLDQWVIPGGFGVAFRWLLLLTLVAATTAWLIMKVGLPYMRSVNRLYAAREIEKADPSLKSSLLNLVDLRAAGREIDSSVMRTLERQAAVQLQQVDVTQVVDHRPLMRTASVLLAVIVVFCIYALLSPKDISNSIWRGLLPAANVELATSTEILNVLPGDVTVVARTPSSRVEIIADLGGVIPEKIFVHYTTSDGKFRDEPVELRADAEGQTRFKGVLVGETGQGLLQDVTYVVRAGDAESKTFRITVEQPPSATPDKVRYEFPSYMKLEPTEQPGGQIESWEGVKATLSAHTNIPVKSASIQFLDEPTAAPQGDDLPMTVSSDGRHLDAKWTLAFRSDGTSYSKHYRIQCKTASGAEDPAPIVYGITIRPDLPPEVALLEPVRDLEAPANATIPLLIQARDPDFELSHINLHVEKLGQSILKDSLSDTKQSRALLKHDLALDRLALNTGDVIEFWVEAFDNKQPRSNRRNTPRLKVTIIEPISDKAARKQLAEDQQQRDQRMAEAQQEQNNDGRPDQPAQEVGANDPPRDPMPNEQPERDPMPRDNAQSNKDETSAKDGQPGADGQGKGSSNEKSPRDPNSNSKPTETANGSGDNKTGDNKTGDGTKPPSDGTKPPSDAPKSDRPKTDGPKQDGSQDGTNSRKNESPMPLSPDGADDEKVLERLVNKLKEREDSKRNDRKQDPPAQDANGTKEPNPNGDSPKSDMPPENGADSKSKDAKPGENSTEQKPPKPNTTKDSKTPSNDEPSTGDDPKEPMPKPGDSTVKPSPENTDPDQPKPNKTSPNKPTKDRTNPDSTQPKEPMPGEGPAKPEAEPDKNGPGTKDAPKPGDSPAKKNENKGPQGADTSKNETADKPAQPADKSDMPDEAAAPDKDKSNKNTPTEKPPGKSPNDKRPGAEDKPDPNAPPSKNNDKKQPGDPDPNAPREPAPESPDAKPEPGDGKNKGPAKPQSDPKVKPTSEKNADAPRDAQDKPNTRPGDPKPEESPATNDAAPPKPGDNKPNKQPQPGKQPNDAPQDQPPSEASEKPPATKPPKKEQESPTADESQPPANKKNQKTNDSNNGGETGGDKPDQTGKPSPQKGPGEAGKQPGNQQPKDSKSQPSEDKQQPGQGAKPGKPGDAANGKPADGKPSSDSGKPGETGKPSEDLSPPSDGKGGDQPGDQPADNKADKNKADKPAGPESEQGPPKPEGQQGQGEKPGDKPGDKSGDKGAGKGAESKDGGKSPGGKPSGKSGKGSSQPGKMSGQGGGSATPGKGGELPDAGSSDEAAALEEEAANLEYNKQATEMVLKRLQKELERGDVDPELLEQLGWTEAEMKRFAERLGKHLEKTNANDETPESAARREQFEEMLKSLDLKKGGTKRTGENSPQREVNQIESRRTNVPPTYKKAFEQFTKDLNRQKQSKPTGSAK